MNDFRRRNLPTSVRDLVSELGRHKIKIPADVAAVLKQLDKLDAARVDPFTQADLIDLYTSGASADAIDTGALRLVTDAQRREAWTEARIQLAKRVESAFRANGDDLTLALRSIAEPLIGQLEQAAALKSDDVAHLLRSGEQESAALVAKLDVIAGDLNSLYALRDKLTRGADYGGEYGIDCRRWRDPRKAKLALIGRLNEADAKTAFLAGIRAGAGLWFPTPAEAEKVARPIGKQIAAEREKEREHKAGVVAFSR